MRLLIAGGGTGGHLYSGMAIAEEVTARGGEVLFVGTARGIEARAVPAAGYKLELLEVSGLKRVGAGAFLRGMARLPLAFTRSLAILRAFRPDVVFGVGGYASGPLVLAAALTGRPSAIIEQNSVPGFTNRVLGRFVRAVFVAFDAAAAAFPAGKVVKTGNPVRKAFLAARAAASPSVRPAGGPARLLLLGGSQGARAVSDLMVGAAIRLAALQRSFTVVHQTGAADAERVTAAYAAAGLAERASVRPFIDDMAAAYAAADVVIARAGALTLAELAIAGRPAILIPLPTAADDHQSKNAAELVSAGAALLFAQTGATGEALGDSVAALLEQPARLAAMATAMAALARPDAAVTITERLQTLAKRPV